MNNFFNLEFFISLLALIISILSLIAAFTIYSRQKFDGIIQSFFNDFTSFLSYAARSHNDEALLTLIKLKVQAGFLEKDLYHEFVELLPIIEHLNLTSTNPHKASDWLVIQKFILDFTKKYNPNTDLDMDYLTKYL